MFCSAACWPRKVMRSRRSAPPTRPSTLRRSPADDLTQRDLQELSLFHPHRLDQFAAAPCARRLGLRAGLQEGRHDRAPTTRSATNRSAASRRRSRTAAGRSIQKIWPPLGTKDFGPFIPDHQGRRRRGVHADGRADGRCSSRSNFASPATRSRSVGGGTSYDEFALPFMGDEVIGDVSALQYSAALETPKNAAFVESLSHQIRQGAVVLLGDQLHHRADDPRGAQGAPRATGRAPRRSSSRWRR